MKTEQEIKEKMNYIQGYKDALCDYIDKIVTTEADKGLVGLEEQLKILEWILEVDNDNK